MRVNARVNDTTGRACECGDPRLAAVGESAAVEGHGEVGEGERGRELRAPVVGVRSEGVEELAVGGELGEGVAELVDEDRAEARAPVLFGVG